MSVIGHSIITLTLGSILYKATQSVPGFFMFLSAGVLIDIDHYIDYVRERGLGFDLKKIYVECRDSYKNFDKIVIFLHSYEIVLISWLLIFRFDLNILWINATMSLALHIFIDQLVNPTVSPFAYFFSFRAINKFKVEKLFKERGSACVSVQTAESSNVWTKN